MLKIYDKEHNAIGHIIKYEDLVIESDVTTGDKTLSFKYLARYHEICEEYYIETESDEFVVKEKSVSTDGFLQFVADLNLEELEAKPWDSFSVTNATIEEAARKALAGTGWTVGECKVTKRRNAGILQTNTLGIIQKLCTAFICEAVYDTRKKTVSFYEEAGENKGIFFLTGLNLKKLQKKGSTYDYYTRIIPIGQDGITIESVNNGKKYLENYQYSKKIKTYIWKDESYTDATALMEDAKKKLEDLSKPVVSYRADIIDLAKQKKEYDCLSFGVGDTVILVDASTGIREKQRILKMTHYPQDPSKDSCELANKIPSFEETREKLQAAQEIINTVITDDGRYTGTIKVSDILNFDNGVSTSPSVTGLAGRVDSLNGELSSLKLTVGSIETNYLKAEEASLKYATIESLKVTNEEVTSIKGKYAEFESTVTKELAADKALIGDLQTKKLSADDAALKYATIENLKATDAKVGNLEADNVTVKEKLTAAEARISTIASDNVTIKEHLSANDASIKNLQTDKLNATDAALKYATVESLKATDAKVGSLEADNVTINNHLSANDASIRSLQSDKLNATDADLKYANIDFSNIGTAAMENFYANSGLIKNVVVGDQTITGELVGVTIRGDLIEGNTIAADKLVIKGSDGLYYKLNTDGMTTEAQQTDYNSLNGQVIRAKSVTAEKISVSDLVAFGATIGGVNIGNSSLYSGAKTSATNGTRGFYLGKDGQVGFGDTNEYIQFYKGVDDKFHLAICAENIMFGKGKKTVEEAIDDIDTKVNNVKSITGKTYKYQSGTSMTDIPTGIWQDTIPNVPQGQYLWTKETTAFSDGTETYGYSAVRMGMDGAIGPKGDKGDTGPTGPQGVKGDTGATGPQGEKGATGATGPQGVKGDTGATGPQGVKGDTGATGNGIKSTAITYQAGSSGTTVPTGTWSTSVPSVSAGQFLWTRTITTYTNGTTTTSYSVGKMGNTGATGATGPRGPQGEKGATGATGPQGVKGDTGATGPQGVKGDTGATGPQGVKGDTGATGPQGVKGDTGATGNGIKSTAITYQAGSSGTTVPTGTWSTSVPSVSAGQFLWTRTNTTYTNGTTATSYSVGKMGNTGATGATGPRGPQGEKGATGATGQQGPTGNGIKSTTITYQLCSSQTSAPTGTWLSSPPKTDTDKPYLWTRTVITYTNNTTSTSYSVSSTFDSIQVGGRNLLQKYIRSGGKTSKIDELSIKIGVGGIGDTYFYLKTWSKLQKGETYTISCDASNVPSGAPDWTFGVRAQNATFVLNINKNGRCYGTGVLDADVAANAEIIIDDNNHPYSTPPPIILSNFKLEIGNVATDWTPAPEDVDTAINEVKKVANSADMAIANWCYNNDTTRIDGAKIYTGTITATQMKAGTITASSGIIADAAITSAKIANAAIGTAKIADGAITNAKIANATIESAKIKSLDAAKITTGTLSADRIDVAGLFAKTITATGTIKGLKLEAATGDITGTFTSSTKNSWGTEWIKIKDGTITAGLDSKQYSLIDAVAQYSDNKYRMVLENSDGIYIKAPEFNIYNGTNYADQRLGISGDTISLYGNASISGELTLNNTVYTANWFRSKNATGWLNETYGGGWYMQDTTWIRAYGNKSIYTPSRVQADGGFDGGQVKVYKSDTNEAQVNVWNTTISGRLVASGSGKFGLYNVSKSLWMMYATSDGKLHFDNAIQSDGVYNNTSSESANMYVSGEHYLKRSVSASKYKLDIQNIKKEESYPYRILNVDPKQWFDKGDVERYSEYLTDLYNDTLDEEKDYMENDINLDPHYGLVAEDIEAAGLPEFCIYHMKKNGDKEIEGIKYDRLPVLMIPILRDLVRCMQEILPVVQTHITDKETKEQILKIQERINSFKNANVVKKQYNM